MLPALAAALRRQAPAAARGAEAAFARSFAAAPAEQMALIKELRGATGAPISEVKSALQEAGWDLEKAGQELRKRGLAAASKKATRRAAEGLVGAAAPAGGAAAALAEVNCETDFAARGEPFQTLVRAAAAAALAGGVPAPGGPPAALDVASLRAPGGGAPLAEAAAELVATVRENVRVRRAVRLAAPPGGAVGAYVHAAAAPGLGRVAALVALAPLPSAAASADPASARALADKLAMHVVAAAPRFLDAAAVPPAAVAAERALLREQAERGAGGKPAAVIERMVEGRLKKFYAEVCLIEQSYALDDKQTVGAVAAAAGLRVEAFAAMRVGEGLEAEEGPGFAAEVEATLREAGGV